MLEKNILPRCPSCRTRLTAEPPTVCSKCNLGIPSEKGKIPQAKREYKPSFSDKGPGVEKQGMSLDTYVDRMKKSGYS
jgi:tRNA(Ile2) C34 agmatinyltransferase TiaS